VPQVLLFIVAGIGVLIARKLYQLERDRIDRAVRDEEAIQERTSPPQATLVQDPATGIYRPQRDRVTHRG
jgi:hypothetical protein